jgi:uncharacterized membrane protein
MNRKFALVIGLVLILISVGSSVYYYPRVPEVMPTHWDSAGQVNGYMPRFWGVSIWPLIAAFFWLQLLVLPIISPRRFRLDQSLETFNLLYVAGMAIMLCISLVALQVAAGTALRIQQLVPAFSGILLIILGNYMGKLTRNFFIGIRTPWTLASAEVWGQTHRVAGRVFVLGGIALCVEAVVGMNQVVFLGILAVLIIVPVAYSFFLYKRIEGFGRDRS